MLKFLKAKLKGVIGNLFARENYLDDPENYKANEKNWVLLLSAVLVEAGDHDASIEQARHDLLEIYPASVDLNRKQYSALGDALELDSKSAIEKRIEELQELTLYPFERDLFRAVNIGSKKAINALADELYEDENKHARLIELWEKKDKLTHVNYRLYLIVDAMWQVRLATYFKIITHQQAWDYLADLLGMMRHLLPVFTDWQAYIDNVYLSVQAISFGGYDDSDVTNIKNITPCLLEEENSPLAVISLHFGVNQKDERNIFEYTNTIVSQVKTADYPEVKRLLELMRFEDKEPLWDALKQLSSHDKNQYLPQFLGCCNNEIFEDEDLLEIPDLYPDESFAYLIRANYFEAFAWDARGGGSAGSVGDENYKLFYERLNYAAQDLWQAHKLSPDEPAIWCDLISVLSHSHEPQDESAVKKLIKRVRKDQYSYPASNRTIAMHKEEKWGGSNDEHFAWAREVMEGSAADSTSALLLYNAAISYWYWFYAFEDDDDKAEAILKDDTLKDELNQYFDELLEKMSQDPARIASTMGCWYALCNDKERFRKVLQSMQPGVYQDSPYDLYYRDDEVNFLVHWGKYI